LSDGQHTLRVYPVSGTIAIDAFAFKTPLVVTPTPTPVVVGPTPTFTPADMPTDTPTATVTLAPDTNLQIVESDAASVLRQGNWTAHDTTAASGGRYIYSSGSLDDTLTTYFQGTRAVVIYVKHPALGVFGIEIDGVPQQVVDSVAPDSKFGAIATVSGLSDGQHTLRVYPVSGTIAIDAFAFKTPLVVTPTPTPVVAVPTATPTSIPPATPTPMALPTTEPLPTATPTALPTSTPLPAPLPLVESFDSGSGWSATGSWRFDTQSAYQGAGWYADSTQRGVVSTLTSDRLIDLRGAAHPQLSFWQKAALSPSDKFAVEISGDGGTSWTALSQQIGPANDWTQLTFDLSPYRDSVIRLRYRLDTRDPLPDGTTTVGVWIDELSIVDIPPAPSVTPTGTAISVPTPSPTNAPVDTPTATPTGISTPTPTGAPTDTPTATSTSTPTSTPTSVPTNTPTATPTSTPTPTPTSVPTNTPTATPTSIPTPTPTSVPTNTPTSAPAAGGA
jgi:hypothetical protein